MKKTKSFLEKIGLPAGDAYDLPDSEKRFNDGAQYRFEVPGIQGPESMEALLEAAEKFGVTIHRITQTRGIMRLTDREVRRMVELAEESRSELVLALGPRSVYDTGASIQTPEGRQMGLRLRGQDQIVRTIEEVKRAAELGCTSFLLYDEGALWVLNRCREEGEIPSECKFKVSVHCGHGNPCSARLLESIGADSFNPVRDIQLQMLAAIRQAVEMPMDIHTDNPDYAGGFIRHYEVPEMIRVAAPVFLKTGGSVSSSGSRLNPSKSAAGRARQVLLAKRMIETYYPEAVTS